MNVVAWARVSSREQREGYSIDAQVRAMRDKAGKAGWTIVKEFVVAESAKRGADRVAFNQMFNWVKVNARREKINAIFAHKLDRVCRNMRDAVRLQELEDTCGVQLTFVENQFGPGAAGALSFNVMAAVAQYYSDNLRTEVIKGMDEKVRQGWPTGLAPFGYTNVDDRNEPVVPHPEKSKTVQRIFELYAGGQYTFKNLADKLAAEGHTFRPSQPRFHRTALSYILNTRFYIGELERNGQVFKSSYRLLIDRRLFDACQDILNGRNRRTGNPDIAFSGGILRCACCEFAMTGELIRRKINGGGCNHHVYYRCGNNHPDNGHPKIRWREADVEQAIVAEIEAFRLPNPKTTHWFRNAVDAAFSDVGTAAAERRKMLTKRRTELTNMLDRLLNGYLAGTIEEAVFQLKSADLKSQTAEVERQLDEAEEFDPAFGQAALSVFDFSQNLLEIWRGSNSARKRTILECVSLNRMLGSASLVLTKRKPFDFLVERPFLKKSRGDWRKLEPAATVQPFVIVFMHGPVPCVSRIVGMVG
ncbi:recombinase family protein [Planctomycetales bacterium ZRK34]|nr:recombinase family protein [Planctomycetales bacterium ZRK34]